MQDAKCLSNPSLDETHAIHYTSTDMPLIEVTTCGIGITCNINCLFQVLGKTEMAVLPCQFWCPKDIVIIVVYLKFIMTFVSLPYAGQPTFLFIPSC